MRNALDVIAFCALYFGVGALLALVRAAHEVFSLVIIPAQVLAATVLAKRLGSVRSSPSVAVRARAGH